jgi:hypothetical protein
MSGEGEGGLLAVLHTLAHYADDLVLPTDLDLQQEGTLHEQIDVGGGEGVAMPIEQRPATAFPELSDDQFGQYAWGEIASLRAAL